MPFNTRNKTSILILAVLLIVASPLMAGGRAEASVQEISRQNSELVTLIKRKGLTESTVFTDRNRICNALYDKDLDALTIGIGKEIKYFLMNLGGLAVWAAGIDTTNVPLSWEVRKSDEKEIVQDIYWIDNVYLQSLKGIGTIVPTEIEKKEAITITDLNMRYGPSANNDIIKIISKFSKVRIVNKDPINGWVKIKHGTEEGFVNGSYLNFAATK